MENPFSHLLSPDPGNTPEDIEIIVRRKRGHTQSWFSKTHILIIEIIALLGLLIWAASFIKAKIDGPMPSANSGPKQYAK